MAETIWELQAKGFNNKINLATKGKYVDRDIVVKTPHVYTGNGAPAANLGENGDIYVDLQ